MARLKALEDYKRELEEAEGPETLLRCALHIARHRFPDLDEAPVYTLLDDMAKRVAAQLPEARQGWRAHARLSALWCMPFFDRMHQLALVYMRCPATMLHTGSGSLAPARMHACAITHMCCSRPLTHSGEPH